MPRDPIAVQLSQLTEVAAPRLSGSRTLGLVGGLAVVAAVLASMVPEPVY